MNRVVAILVAVALMIGLLFILTAMMYTALRFVEMMWDRISSRVQMSKKCKKKKGVDEHENS